MPCWLAGRFCPQGPFRFQLKSQVCGQRADLPPQGPFRFQLKSQGLVVDCEKAGSEPKLQAGEWMAVKLLSKKNRGYLVSEYKALSHQTAGFKERAFSYSAKGEIIQNWERFLSAVKEFFYAEGLAAAGTPSLAQCPGTEPHLQAFQTSLDIKGSFQKMYLPTSPEMSLKKLLCQDWTDFFEIKKCFRQGELSRIHQPEFTLLEWYRAFYSLEDLINETGSLLAFLKEKGFIKAPLPPAQVYTVAELFKKRLGFSLRPQTSLEDMRRLARDQNLPHGSEAGFEDIFFLIFLNRIEPKLPKHAPVFICDYPPRLRAFSQLNERGWADRFELFWRGLELANAFYEVTDPQEQKSLFKLHLEQREDDVPWDEDLLSCMRQGMPPGSGIALGLDRLFLAIYEKEDLKDTRLFPL